MDFHGIRQTGRLKGPEEPSPRLVPWSCLIQYSSGDEWISKIVKKCQTPILNKPQFHFRTFPMLKAAVVLFLLLLLPFSSSTWPWSSDPPIPSQKEKTWFPPRLLTHLYQYHPPREDGTLPIWPEDGKHGNWRKMMPLEREYFEEKVKKVDPDPKWEEILVTDWEYSKDPRGERFRRHQLENPNFRKVEYPGDEICSQPGDTKIVQRFTEPGLPFEIPCYSCSPPSNISAISFHFLPKRDFYYLGSSSFADRLSSFPMSSFDPDMTYQVPLLPALFHSVHHLLTATPKSPEIIQSLTRSVGGQTWWDRGSYLEGTGRLQISPSEQFFQNMEANLLTGPGGPEVKEIIKGIQEIQAVKYGATYRCAQSGSRTTDVVVNVDSLVLPEDTVYPLPETFDQIYETWNSQWDLSNLTFNQENLKIEMEWEPWGCCSACCCSVQMCGSLATERMCNLVYSVRVRKGYLSLKKIHHDLPVNFGVSFTEDIYATELDHLERIFDVSPYNIKGIPLYSSIIPLPLRGKIHEKFTSKFIEVRNSPANLSSYHGTGLFLQSKSCQDDPQKLDCALLAACREMSEYAEKKKEIAGEEQEETDPCQGVALKSILLTKNLTKIQVEPGQSYRLQVDETVYVVGRWVRWQIQREVVGRYDYTKDCGQQGRAVHPNGIHLLVTNLKEKELRMTILAVLDTGERLFVRTEETEDEGIDGHDVMMIAIWGGVILGFVLLLVGFVWYMHKFRLTRIGSQLREAERTTADTPGTLTRTDASSRGPKTSTNQKK